MVFSSSLFLLYFLPAFLIIYYLLPARLKNLFALIASIFFYAWGAPIFIFVVLGSIIVDFYIVKSLYASEGKTKKCFACQFGGFKCRNVAVLQICKLFYRKC